MIEWLFPAGHFNYNGKSYWVSWSSDEQKLRNARWNWFTGRNYCRKMCMDMVSFETQREQQFIEGLMNNVGLDNLHTAGRLCDAEVEGCNQTRFQPLRINGWFWASTLKMMPPTNVQAPNRFVSWTPFFTNSPLPHANRKSPLDAVGAEMFPLNLTLMAMG